MPLGPLTERAAPFTVAPHLSDATGGLAVWFTEPPGAIIQIAKPCHLTAEMARWLVGPGLTAFAARFPEPARLILVLDLGLMDGRDVAVRPLIIDAAKDLRPRLARAILLPPRRASAIYIASLKTGVAMLRVFGVTIEIARALSDVVSSAALRPAVGARPSAFPPRTP
jgi:hypothetical protein